MASQALFPLPTHQKDILYLWSKEYTGNLGIALSDTLGSNSFFKAFTFDLAKMYDGVRQDSGDPYMFAAQTIAHYKKLGIDPLSKTIIFSDSLNINSAIDLYKAFKDKIKISFGIGTNLTNDCGEIPLSIVIKIRNVNNMPVAKISDDSGKSVCDDPNYLEFIKNFVQFQCKE